MPYSIYASLNIGPLKETSVVIQLADKSNAYPKGVLEDVFVRNMPYTQFVGGINVFVFIK